MSHWGSFSPDSYESFLNGVSNPTNFMVVAPALAARAATAPSSYYMDEPEDEEEEGMYGGDYEDEDEEEFEPNAGMAMNQLKSMAEDIMHILSQLTPEDNLEPWIAAKITMSKQNLSAVADYMRFDSDYAEGEFDFTRCKRPDGSYYGTDGKCDPPNVYAPPTKEAAKYGALRAQYENDLEGERRAAKKSHKASREAMGKVGKAILRGDLKTVGEGLKEVLNADSEYGNSPYAMRLRDKNFRRGKIKQLQELENRANTSGYSEGDYDFKRCVTPSGEFFGVGDNEKCVPPNKEAKEAKEGGFESGLPADLRKAGGGGKYEMNKGKATLGNQSGTKWNNEHGTEFFQIDNPPNSYRTWYKTGVSNKWKPMGQGI